MPISCQNDSQREANPGIGVSKGRNGARHFQTGFVAADLKIGLTQIETRMYVVGHSLRNDFQVVDCQIEPLLLRVCAPQHEVAVEVIWVNFQSLFKLSYGLRA